jgi:hypothetical protein
MNPGIEFEESLDTAAGIDQNCRPVDWEQGPWNYAPL